VSIEQIRVESDRRLVTVVIVVFLVPGIWYLRTDFELYAGNWERLSERLVARALMVAAGLVTLALLRRTSTRKSYSRLVFGFALASAAFSLAINALRPLGGTLPLRTPLFTLFMMYAALPNGFWRQATPALLLSAGVAALRLTRLTSGTESDIPGDLLIVAAMNAIGLLVVRRRLRLEANVSESWHAEHDARLSVEHTLSELKLLRGIIPICLHCKKVRTEGNDWQHVERYVHEHSEAKFSHGLCPDCAQTHYPG
jgi:hypothetical protein